jgi:hypothetical protein
MYFFEDETVEDEEPEKKFTISTAEARWHGRLP